MKQKRWFFEKINKIYKPLANVTKIRRPKLIKLETKKGRDSNKHQGHSGNHQGLL
jgi:transketolase